MLYRTLLPLLGYLATTVAAPQELPNSDITYVKIQPIPDDPPLPKSLYRESRIENIPLTIPGNLGDDKENKQAKRESVTTVSSQEEDKFDVLPTTDSPSEEVNSSRQGRSEDISASYETETVEPTGVTESTEQLIQQTEEYETRTKAPSPRFISKLSYFQKNDVVRSSIATNLVELTGKRRFKSKCRCEKIWNCPKLQITVPRCPNEYFLCCFP